MKLDKIFNNLELKNINDLKEEILEIRLMRNEKNKKK